MAGAGPPAPRVSRAQKLEEKLKGKCRAEATAGRKFDAAQLRFRMERRCVGGQFCVYAYLQTRWWALDPEHFIGLRPLQVSDPRAGDVTTRTGLVVRLRRAASTGIARPSQTESDDERFRPIRR